MQNTNNILLVSTSSKKIEKIDNFPIHTIDGLFAIQSLHGIPKYLYIYKSKKFTIYQVSPYKLLKSFTYKEEVIDFCFSFCGSYMFIMSSDRILVFNNERQVAKIHGNFVNCRIASFFDSIVVIGNYNIFIFEHNNNENQFFEMTKDDTFEFGLKKKYTGSACFITYHSILHSKDSLLYIELSNIQLTVKFPTPIVKILCKTVHNMVYCLCSDSKVYKTMLDGTKSVKQIDEDEVLDIAFTFNEKYIVIKKKRSMHIFETVNDILIDEACFDEDIGLFACALEMECNEKLLPITIIK